MRFLNKRAIVLYSMFILLLPGLVGGVGAVAFADSGTHAKAVVKGGTLTLHGSGSSARSIVVLSKNTIRTTAYTLPLSVVDARGNGGGWNLTITSTQFSTGGVRPQILPLGASTINASPEVVCTTGNTCTLPVNQVSYVHPLTVPSGAKAPAAIKFFSAAAGTGLGSFTITPTITILIPAKSYTGVYKCVVSVTIVSGP